MTSRLALLSLSLFLASAAQAQLMPGDIFVSDQGAGAVYEISGGGDVSLGAPFASGLNNPQDLCVGPNGDLYVSEQFDDEVTIITTGVAVPHATSLDAPMGLLCSDTQVLVVEFDTGEVTDITVAGDYAGAPAFASGLTGPVGLLRDSLGSILVTENPAGEITNIVAGGDFTGASAFAFNQPGLMGLGQFGGALLVAAFTPNTVIDFSAGGDLTMQPVIASVANVTQVENVDGVLLAISATAEIVYDITTGTPTIFASGFDNLNLTGGIAHVPSAFCGDGTVDAGEECDDGNTVGGDGCRADCTIEACGDGTVDPGEDCDDGNTVLGDGCRNDCTAEVCGDGIPDAGEACDDGNTVLGDGCRNDCTAEVCGDGIPDAGEACDDGNTVLGDGCRNDCTAEACGDGITDLGEGCDDGNTVGGDGCSATCQNEACGDGNQDPSEACDDGNTVTGDGCDAQCNEEVCGNGVEQPAIGEECDDGNTVSGDGCTSECVLEVCGDGVVQPPEDCDDGNTLDGDSCPANCMEIPEPAAPLLLLVGALVLLGARRRAATAR